MSSGLSSQMTGDMIAGTSAAKFALVPDVVDGGPESTNSSNDVVPLSSTMWNVSCVVVKCLPLLLFAIAYIWAIGWGNHNGARRRMGGYFRESKQNKLYVKLTRAILIAIGTFTRSYGGCLSHALVFVAATLRSAPIVSWNCSGIFWRRPRTVKCLRLLLFSVILTVAELYFRYVFGFSTDVFGLQGANFTVIFASTLQWVLSTLVQSVCLFSFGACAIPIEASVVLLLLSRIQAAFPTYYDASWGRFRLETALTLMFGFYFLWVNYALAYNEIEYTVISAPVPFSLRAAMSMIWLQVTIGAGGLVQVARLTSTRRDSGLNGVLYLSLGNWSHNMRISILLSRALQRALFKSYSGLLRYQQNVYANGDKGTPKSILRKVARLSTSMALGSLQKTGLRQELFVPQQQQRRQQEERRAPPNNWGDPSFIGTSDNEGRCLARGDSNSLFALILMMVGVCSGSRKALVFGPSLGLAGLLLRLLPTSDRITQAFADYLIHIGSLSFGVMQLFTLGITFCVEVLLVQCRKSFKSWDVQSARTRSSNEHVAGEYKGARPGCPSKTKNLASNLDNNKNDSLTTRAVLRSKSYPTNHNQTHFHGRSKECRGKLEAETASTRVCCICYEDVSLSDGVLCRKDEDKSLRMGLPVHFTCDACLEKHVQTQFPQETPVCAELARLGRGDGGLYCPCHPGKPINVIQIPFLSGNNEHEEFGGESKCDAAVETECCAPAFDMALLATHLSRRAFHRCLAIRAYVGEQRVFEDTTAKWQARYSRAVLQIKEQKAREDRNILAEQLKRQFPNARQCKLCGHGPILHFACSNLATHHGERNNRGGSINNACVKCGWFAQHIREWPKWNGKLGDDLNVSNIDASTFAAEEALIKEKESQGKNVPDTIVQRTAQQARLSATAARRAAVSAQADLAALRSRRAGPSGEEGTKTSNVPQNERRRLTHDLRRMVEEGVITEDQAQDMMPAADESRTGSDLAEEFEAASAVASKTNVVIDEDEAIKNVAQLNLNAMRLEYAAVKAEQAASKEIEALDLGDDGSLMVFEFSTIDATSASGRSDDTASIMSQGNELARDKDILLSRHQLSGILVDENGNMETGDDSNQSMPAQEKLEAAMASGVYEASLICSFCFALLCCCTFSFVCRRAISLCVQVTWSCIFMAPPLLQIFFTLLAGCVVLVGASRREALQPYVESALSLFSLPRSSGA